MLGVDWPVRNIRKTTVDGESRKSEEQKKSERNQFHIQEIKGEGTSYTFGPHTRLRVNLDGYKPYIMYTADERIVLCRPDKVRCHRVSPPAWLVAEWALAKHKGQPISQYQSFAIEASRDHPSLQWIHSYLDS